MPIQKSNSSNGKWSISLNIEWENGLKANTFRFYWNKKEAIKDYYKLKTKEEE